MTFQPSKSIHFNLLNKGIIPTIDEFSPGKIGADKKTLLRDIRHDWTKAFEGGPSDIGFDTSYISTGGIQNPPYAFYRNSKLEANLEDIIFWQPGNYSMPSGISRIKSKGGKLHPFFPCFLIKNFYVSYLNPLPSFAYK